MPNGTYFPLIGKCSGNDNVSGNYHFSRGNGSIDSVANFNLLRRCEFLLLVGGRDKALGIIRMGFLHAFLIIAFWYFADGNNWTVLSAITATAFSVVMYAVFTAVAWCLLAKPRE